MWIPCSLLCLVLSLIASACCQDDVRKPPTIAKHPRASIIYRSDDSVTLECKAEGIPAVTYEWQKNYVELNLNRFNIEKGVDGSITIKDAAASDEGYYQCFARNQYGTAVSNTAHIQRAVLAFVSNGIPAIRQQTVQEGMPFHIQVDTRRSFPKPDYGWEMATDTVDKNPIPLRLSRRIQLAENGDLYFAYALPEDGLDGKLYKSTTYNPYLDVKLSGGYTRLTVTRNPAGLRPSVPTFGFVSAQQTVAVIGGTVTLRCFCSGYPEPTITWSGRRNSLPIGRYSLTSFNTQLTIINVTASDEGDYICSGSNTYGSALQLFEIRVEAVPKFLTAKNGPYDVNVTEGESFTFNCNATAKPEATIAWFQDGQLLDVANPPRRFVFSNNKKILTIRDVCRNCEDRIKQTDLMVIQCNASNVHGSAFGQGYLNVLKKTEVTIHNASEVTVNTNEGGRVEFDCRATTDPSTPPTFRWFKVRTEGDQLVYSEPPFLTINRGLLSIHVTANAIDNWPKYLGQYRCVVDTGHSRVNQTATVNPAIIVVPTPETVRKPPTITKHPVASIIYRSDDSVTLECKAEGIPVVTYKWKKNSLELNTNQPNTDKGVDGSITIKAAASSDEGFYQCFARNQYGTALSTTAHIQRALLDSASEIPVVHQKTVQEGMPFHIQADQRRSFPKPTYYGWEMATDTEDRNPVPLRPSRRIQLGENGDLYFAYALPEDALDGKFYKFTTYNPYLDVKLASGYTDLTVTRNPDGLRPFAPTLGFASTEQSVAVIGGSVTLRCFFSGYPEPTITWSGPKNTLPIGRYALNSFNSQLTINNVAAADEGDYFCAGSNTQGRTTHVLQIRVEEAPVFRSVKDGPYNVNVTEGESVTFNCNVTAKPDATIVWLQDGVPLDVNNPPRRFAFSRNKKSLTIRDVCRDCVDRESKTDLMVIQCNASNVHGYAFASGYLNVLLRTKVTLQPYSSIVSVDLTMENRLQFDCTATSDPSTPPTIRWHKIGIQGQERVYNESPYVFVMDGSLTMNFGHNCSTTCEKYYGEYRCIGDNRYTQDTATFLLNGTIETTTKPPLPPGPLLWIIIGIAIGFFVLLLILICCIVCYLNKGDEYDVDGNERKSGKIPEEEILSNDFEEFFLCADVKRKGSGASMGSTVMFKSMDNINEFDEDMNFGEDGSFVGKYA